MVATPSLSQEKLGGSSPVATHVRETVLPEITCVCGGGRITI